MKHARLLAMLLTSAAAAAPLCALAMQGPHGGYREYRIEFVSDDVHSLNGGATVGLLDLKTEDNGIVNGFFRPNDGGRLVQINGSLDGKSLNLRASGDSNVNLNGTYDHGKIVGSGFIGRSEVDFVATPQDDAPIPAAGVKALQ